ncbi:MAG: hypothetical protein K2M50_01975 [Treponemataceae bacterium]|nr:hypothetical protein [Treponema sp.]MBD5442862.1 hypothetical protein [Treponema sp.]MDE6244406.1 hypothetical protein [Treponemataceae bacterium]MDE7383401.1 hypothetical protein [Treponemataceae bacterium]
MKKLVCMALAIFSATMLFAASYTDNTYQKLADEYTKKAKIAFDSGHYDDAAEYSQKAAENAALSKEYIDRMMARENTSPQQSTFPEYYIVDSWIATKDCYWNISALPCVYNNPFLWKRIYQENKQNMPNPDNPNLIKPGMKIKIPSINGEHREGIYDPSKTYSVYGK